MKYTVKTIHGARVLGHANTLTEAKEIAARHSHNRLRWSTWRKETGADRRSIDVIYSDDDEMIELNR